MAGSHTPTSPRDTSLRDTSLDRNPLTLVSSLESGLPERLAGRVDGHLATFAEHMREGLLAASTAVGLEVMAELMDAEVTELVGPKGRHDPDRAMNRHGTEPATVTLGGRRVPVRRPRVRTVADDAGGEPEREVPLETYTTLAAADLLAEGIVARMLAGISTRRYPVALEPVGTQVEQAARSTSKSAVSRRFVNATAERLAELSTRRLADQRWLIVYLDGFSFGDHTLIGALGVTSDGTKVPLGVVEGSTENAAVCTRLVSDLAARGLDATRGVLFVVDGGKAIAKAVDDVYGDLAVTHRCRIHKERNILDHLPEHERPLVRRKLRAAWTKPTVAEAKSDLEALARSLAKQRPGAAASLREGLDQTLTVTRLGVTGTLLRTVASTNPMESMIEIIRDHALRVKHWSSGDMALRWAAAGMVAAESQFRRVKGYRQLPELARALEQAVGYEPAASDVAHAATA
ncbi:MAG TPA: IS256 family transposase [Jiangellaceae bacterium]|nr:IS256 family transposase [Jiangellaceae bacterium]